LPEVLARSHNDSILSGPARKSPRKTKNSLVRSAMRAFLSRPARTIAGATLAAIMTGIVVNALLMQKERHSAPFFGPARPGTISAAAPPAPAAAAAPAPAPSDSAPAVAQPPVRPAHLGAAIDPAPPPPAPPSAPRSGDSIRDLLRGDSAKEATRLTLAAQNALVRLGYVVKADGAASAATTKAIEMFERAHGMTPSGEVTAKLVRQLNAAVAAETR
jgi:Putative peptidoglycan binding domain